MENNKEALVLVLDVSILMVDGPEGTETSLSKSLEAISMILLRKISSQSKDEVALVAFGTAETKNQLSESLGGCENISILHGLEAPSIEFLRMVKDEIKAGTETADFVDAIVVAFDHLMDRTRGRKMNLRIVLFSNLASNFSMDNLEGVVDSMKKANVQMTFIGPEMENEVIDDVDGEGSNFRDSKTRDERERNSAKHKGKPLSSQQLEGIKCIRGILDQLDGEGMSLADVLPMLSFFQTRSVQQSTTFRGPIEIGDTIKINVYGYVKVKELKATSFKKLSALSEASKIPGNMKVSMQRSHRLQDEDFTEVDDEHVVKAYKYGKSFVPYSKIDEQSLKMQTEKCMKVLGFTDRSKIVESNLLGESVVFFIPQPGDEAAAVAFSALVHALEEKNMVAIVRYCRCKNANPKLAVLVPEIKFSYEGFYMFFLPFAEDIRRYSFGSLENVKITDEQIDAIDSIIDGMDLTNAQIDEDGKHSEAFKPKNILNPSIQRQYQCVQNRALHPEEETLPQMDGYIKSSLEILPEHSANCRQFVEKIKEVFPLTVVDKKAAKGNKNIFQQRKESSELEAKKLKASYDGVDATDFRFSALLEESITKMGTLIKNSDSESFISGRNGSVYESTDDQFQGLTLQASKTFDHEGGALEIVGSSVSVKVPKGAINEGEIKDIDVRVKLCRPSDWKCLGDNGYTTALPHIELGPNGLHFNNPIEVLMESNASLNAEDDVTFEFTEGPMNEKSEWLPAAKCSSRVDAISMSLRRDPHVSFCLGDRFLHAFYLHFTGGRWRNKIPKEQWFKLAAFVNTNKMTGDRLAIKVVLYRSGKDERTVLSEQLRDFSKVPMTEKSILISRAEQDSVKTDIYGVAKPWALKQGERIQTFLVSYLFHPKYNGTLTSVDYVFCNQGNVVSHFECMIDVINGTKKVHDLKVNIGGAFIQDNIFSKRQIAAPSLDYHTDDRNGNVKRYYIDDNHFRFCEPFEYIQSLFTPISEYMAGYYRTFARYLGIDEYMIETVVTDHPNNAREACIRLLTEWLRSQPDILGKDFKNEMLRKIEDAINRTNPPFHIVLPDFSHEPVPMETTV